MDTATGAPLDYTADEAAGVARVHPITLAKWRSAGKGPAYYRVGGRIYYSRVDLLAWLDAQRVRAAV